MAKQRATPEYVTREILKEEISASEKRLTAKIGEEISGVEKRFTETLNSKIESTTQSLKEYTDSRFTQVVEKIDGVALSLTQLDAKMTANQKDILHVLSNHEERITVLERRGPQASRI